MVREQFIERATEYPLEHGVLTIYETNCPCRDVKFFFEENVLTLMLRGHKTVVSEKLTVEFFPNTFFIPEKNCVQTIAIPNASFDNPTKCLVLNVEKSFLAQAYHDLQLNEASKDILFKNGEEEMGNHFMSNESCLIENFKRLYKARLRMPSKANEMICTLYLKELLLRLYQTRALVLLKDNFEEKEINPTIQKAIRYIKSNLQNKITVKELASLAGLGVTSFNNKFKAATGFSPIEFLFKERINHAKILILKEELPLKEIAFNCGFNSYEYFCSSFKKLENIKPSEFKNSRNRREVIL